MVTLECGIYDVEAGVPLEDFRKNMAKALDVFLAQGATWSRSFLADTVPDWSISWTTPGS